MKGLHLLASSRTVPMSLFARVESDGSACWLAAAAVACVWMIDGYLMAGCACAAS